MAKKELIIIADYSQQTLLTLDELRKVSGLSEEFLRELMAYEIIRPIASNHELFDLTQLQRIKTVLRLQHDLEVNLAGIALVLDLLDQLDELRTQMDLMQKHYK